MNVRLSPQFIDTLKKVDVRIRKSFFQQIAVFEKNPYEYGLRNHPLRGEWAGYRSINITNDYRAIYWEVHEGGEEIAYFITLGTHKELYG